MALMVIMKNRKTIEYREGLVASQHFTETKALADTVPILNRLKERAALFPGAPPVEVWYTDLCCTETVTLRQVFGPELKGYTSYRRYSHLQN